jgi:DNA-binding transcriptional regulator YiaG
MPRRSENGFKIPRPQGHPGSSPGFGSGTIVTNVTILTILTEVFMARPRKEVDTSTYAGRFAVQIKTIREKRKLTIDEVAAQSEIPISTLYSWEQGIKEPTISRLPILAQVFGTTVNKLMPQN